MKPRRNFVGISRMFSDNGKQYGALQNLLPSFAKLFTEISEIECIIHFSICFSIHSLRRTVLLSSASRVEAFREGV